jgi:hypothetical protein
MTASPEWGMTGVGGLVSKLAGEGVLGTLSPGQAFRRELVPRPRPYLRARERRRVSRSACVHAASSVICFAALSITIGVSKY